MTRDVIKIRSRQSSRINARREWGAHHFFELQRNFARAMLQAWEWSLIQPMYVWRTEWKTKKRNLAKSETATRDVNLAFEWAVSDDGSFELCCAAAGQNPRVLRRYAGIVEAFRWGDQMSRISKEQVDAWKQQAARELGLAPPVELWKREKISTGVDQ